MSELQPIRTVIARARRRVRFQAAIEWGTTAVVPAVAASLVILWLWRMEYLPPPTALALAFAAATGVVGAGVVGAARRISDLHVATKLDRASGLESRIATAWELAHLPGSTHVHSDTQAMMQAAIQDGLRVVSKASVAQATPLRVPRDSRAAMAFLAVGLAVTSLAFSPRSPLETATPGDAHGQRTTVPPETDNKLDQEDVDFSRDLLLEIEQVAKETGDAHLDNLARSLEKLLEKAGNGSISKQELLAEMEKLEREYNRAIDPSSAEALKELKETARELEKEPLTRKIGEALEKGDLPMARRELERLAREIEGKSLGKTQDKKLEDLLRKVVTAHDKKQEEERAQEEKADQKAEAQIEKKREEVRRLQKKVQEQPQDEHAKRRLHREQRELERLERDRAEQRAHAKKRRLERLHRNLERTAEGMRKDREQAAQGLKSAAEDISEIEDEIRKLSNQKRTKSQLADLKEALRRSKSGQKQNQGRALRLKDFQRRASGHAGIRKAWRPMNPKQGERPGPDGKAGLSRGGMGPFRPGSGPNPGGEQQPGTGAGDDHDPNLMGDPTPRYGDTKDVDVSGVHGQGPSRRETILTSAQKGFASAAYKRVFTDYQRIVEEIMSQEKVPQGYKHYVKRYFQKIKPHAME
ncbi:MAG: hypothetical protein HY698_17175 [Deltaproteobacteria bacterium]|nr:hypothetical protein [Deltaproteobacteria bacterium]